MSGHPISIFVGRFERIDAAAADRTFDMLMGSAGPPRTRFIQTRAKSVRNLDV